MTSKNHISLDGLVYFVWSAAGLMVLVIFTFLYLVAFPVKTITVCEPIPVKNINEVLKPGSCLVLVLKCDKKIDKQAEITYEYINHIIYSTVSYYSTLPKGNYCIDYEVIIPETLLPGTYELKLTFTYKINRLRVIEKSFKTEKFIVSKG